MPALNSSHLHPQIQDKSKDQFQVYFHIIDTWVQVKTNNLLLASKRHAYML